MSFHWAAHLARDNTYIDPPAVCDGCRPPSPWTGVLHWVRVTVGRQAPPEPDQIRVALHID